jgi:tetratricopeptide (TPR) repeat protein
MLRSLFALSLLLVAASGCRHAKVPALPASHGHLALALDKYLELPTKEPGAPALTGTPEVVVEPAQTPAVFAEAVQVLQGKPTEAEVRQASEDLSAACEAPFQQACDWHPIEIPYTIRAKMAPSGVELTPEEQLKWVRMRAEAFPWSVPAWFGLASTLARQAPEDPAYLPALRHLNELDPRYWWSANELAWMHVQAGRYAEAARLSRRAREAAPRNPYVLETSAATLSGLGQCEEAVAEQRRAAEGLPDEWPAPEQERFLSTLREYTQRCKTGAPPVPATPPR